MTVDTQTSITDITLVNDHGVPDDNLTNSTRPQFGDRTRCRRMNSVQLSIDGGAKPGERGAGYRRRLGLYRPTDMGDGKHTPTVSFWSPTERAHGDANVEFFFIDTRLSTPTIALDSTDDTGTPGDDMTNRHPTDLYSAEYRFGCYQRYSQRHA